MVKLTGVDLAQAMKRQREFRIFWPKGTVVILSVDHVMRGHAFCKRPKPVQKSQLVPGAMAASAFAITPASTIRRTSLIGQTVFRLWRGSLNAGKWSGKGTVVIASSETWPGVQGLTPHPIWDSRRSGDCRGEAGLSLEKRDQIG